MFPTISVNVHVLNINPKLLQSINPDRSSVNVAFNNVSGVQLSASSVTSPVTDVPISYVQLEALQIVTLPGTLNVGLVISCTVIVCMHSLKFPATSVALHVLVIV